VGASTITSAKPVKRRTQAERRDHSERSLVGAAIAVVSNEGVAAATFENIGRQAKCSRGLVTERFGSKSGLIESVIHYLHERPEAVAAERRLDELPGLEGLLAYADMHLEHLATGLDGQAYSRLLAAAVADNSGLTPLFAAAHELFQNRVAECVQRAKAEKTIRAGLDPKAVGLMVGALVLGLAIQKLVDPEMSIAKARQTCAKSLRHAFAVSQDEKGRKPRAK
jgi:AcrR family transcriptional regulator